MQDVVKQTLLAAYKFDKKRGALQNVGDEEIVEIVEKISDGEYWKSLDQDE